MGLTCLVGLVRAQLEQLRVAALVGRGPVCPREPHQALAHSREQPGLPRHRAELPLPRAGALPHPTQLSPLVGQTPRGGLGVLESGRGDGRAWRERHRLPRGDHGLVDAPQRDQALAQRGVRAHVGRPQPHGRLQREQRGRKVSHGDERAPEREVLGGGVARRLRKHTLKLLAGDGVGSRGSDRPRSARQSRRRGLAEGSVPRAFAGVGAVLCGTLLVVREREGSAEVCVGFWISRRRQSQRELKDLDRLDWPAEVAERVSKVVVRRCEGAIQSQGSAVVRRGLVPACELLTRDSAEVETSSVGTGRAGTVALVRH